MSYPHAIVHWDADAIAAWEREAPAADDDPRARIALLSPTVEGQGAVEVIPTWGAETPPGTWVEVQLVAQRAGAEARHFRVAAWDDATTASRRTSFASQKGPDGRLATDTLILVSPARIIQVRVLLCAEPGADMPELTALTLALTADGQATGDREPRGVPAQPSALQMPLLLSQYLAFPDYGHLWCSPTSIAMVLAYWYEHTGDPRLMPFLAPESVPATLAPMIYDPGWEGTGNWAFNTAFAAALGQRAYVTRLHSLEQLARWTAAGVPVPISLRWEPGELDGADGRTAGHINVVTGFAGDQVLMAEPATRNHATVARSYRADQLYACWQRASQGVVYLIHPLGWPTPPPRAGDAWV